MKYFCKYSACKRKSLFVGILSFFIVCYVWAGTDSNQQRNVTDARSSETVQHEDTGDARIYLIHSDVLYKSRRDSKAEILVGNVQLSHKGAILYCDSARYYRADNSFDAYGNVYMVQGDTLKLYSDTLFYKGNEMSAHAVGDVVLYHNESRLETDFLDYFRYDDIAEYREGGTLFDKDNVLYSRRGQYQVNVNEAMFVDSVFVENPNFTMETGILYYYTDTEIAKIVSPTEIKAANGAFVYSENGCYDTQNSWADLLDRSYVIKDMRRIEADSLHFNSETMLSEAFGDVVLNDAGNSMMILGNHCEYDDMIGYAMATDSLVLIDYSSPDTMFVHGDTLKMFTYNINTDSIYRNVHIYNKVRMFRNDVQGVCDSLVILSKDSCAYFYGQPIIWNEAQQIFGEEIRVYANDSTIDWIHVINQAMTIEMVDSVSYNQVASREMYSYFQNGEIEHTEAHGNVYVVYFIDEDDGSRIGMNYTETSLLHLYLKDRHVDKIWMPSSTGMLYPAEMIPVDRRYLTNFAWFDYVRPKHKDDIFVWQSKADKDILKKTAKRNVPLQKLDKLERP